MKRLKSCFTKTDEFGTWAKFHYKNESGFGTTIGGICSLILYTITLLFAMVQIFGWFYYPSYSQTTEEYYIPNAETP